MSFQPYWAYSVTREYRVLFRFVGSSETLYYDVGTHVARRENIEIHFVGVWDTVAAYGLPIDELTIAVDKWVWPMKFEDTSLLERVRHARHALALDDERRTFYPIPWDEREEKKQRGTVDPDRLTQVWFPGMHAADHRDQQTPRRRPARILVPAYPTAGARRLTILTRLAGPSSWRGRHRETA